MGSILPILLNAVFVGGGGFLSNLLRKSGMSMLGNLLGGAGGGIILPLLTKLLSVGTAAAATTDGSGTGTALTITGILTALLGGGAGSQIGGLLSGRMGGNKTS